MNELTDFLAARLQEDREHAEAGKRLAQHLSKGSQRDPGNSRAYAAAIQREGGYAPDRVLAEVAAKEAILAIAADIATRQEPILAEWQAMTEIPRDRKSGDDHARQARLKHSLTLLEGEAMAIGAALRRLADVYTHHPDYQKAWSW